MIRLLFPLSRDYRVDPNLSCHLPLGLATGLSAASSLTASNSTVSCSVASVVRPGCMVSGSSCGRMMNIALDVFFWRNV